VQVNETTTYNATWLDLTQWHTYRLTVKDGKTSLYIDTAGTRLSDIPVQSGISAYSMIFGDLTGGGMSTMEVDYIRWTNQGAYPLMGPGPDASAELVVTPVNQSASPSAGTVTFDVANFGNGTMNWTAQVITGGEWLTVNPSSGINGGTMTASFAANTGSAERTATIRITADGADNSPIDVTVVQAAAPTPTPTPSYLAGDCDRNGVVNYADFVTLKSNFGKTGMGWAQGDFDGNGKVDYGDFVTLKSNFGKTGGVSSSQMAQFQADAEACEAAFAPKEAMEEVQETLQQSLPCSPLGLVLMSLVGLALYSLSSLREQE